MSESSAALSHSSFPIKADPSSPSPPALSTPSLPTPNLDALISHITPNPSTTSPVRSTVTFPSELDSQREDDVHPDRVIGSPVTTRAVSRDLDENSNDQEILPSEEAGDPLSDFRSRLDGLEQASRCESDDWRQITKDLLQEMKALRLDKESLANELRALQERNRELARQLKSNKRKHDDADDDGSISDAPRRVKRRRRSSPGYTTAVKVPNPPHQPRLLNPLHLIPNRRHLMTGFVGLAIGYAFSQKRLDWGAPMLDSGYFLGTG